MNSAIQHAGEPSALWVLQSASACQHAYSKSLIDISGTTGPVSEACGGLWRPVFQMTISIQQKEFFTDSYSACPVPIQSDVIRDWKFHVEIQSHHFIFISFFAEVLQIISLVICSRRHSRYKARLPTAHRIHLFWEWDICPLFGLPKFSRLFKKYW